MEYRNKKVLVLGMGKSGTASGNYLCRQGAEVRYYDDHIPTELDNSLFCRSYDFAVISPGISLSNRSVVKLRENDIPILSELDLAYINCDSKHLFAVSGTNGKTTTCHVLHRMLGSVGRSHLVGNVGVPFIRELDHIGKKDSVVVEVSSFQIEQSVLFHPQIAALTNVGEDHLDRHSDADTYHNIKLSLLNKEDVKVVNADDPNQSRIKDAIRYSTRDDKADFFLGDHVLFHGGKGYPLPASTRGKGYDLDYLCAFAVAATYSGVKKSFLSLYDKVPIPSYRCQPIGNLCGAQVINDSKGTNIDATLFALTLLDLPTALILGGSDKGEDYTRLMGGIPDHVERIYLTGSNAHEMYVAADERVRARCVLMSDLDSCVRDFVRDPLAVLLFSPASASFDRFKNYEERGRCFDEIVEKYRKECRS